MAPIVDYEKWRDQQKQDPEFIAELEKLEPGYQVARLWIKLVSSISFVQIEAKSKNRRKK